VKFCYCDESGHGDGDPCFVGVGIIVDAARLNRTTDAFGEMFAEIQTSSPEQLREIKASKLLMGRDRWRQVSPEVRKRICESLCRWVVDRKHNLILTAIDRSRYGETRGAAPVELQKSHWVAGMTHLALQLQRLHQGQPSNKGRTVLLIDDNKQFADHLAEFLWSPPAWTDTFYQKKRKQEQLDQIIDSAFAVKSHHAGLIQIADLFALVFRRHSEMADYASAEEWLGERQYVSSLVATLTPRLTQASCRWPRRPQCACTRWYNALAPQSLLQLNS
jgi:hypothetical protein